MATLTGTNLLDSIIDSTGIEPNALIYATLSAKLQQMIDNGTYSKLAAGIAVSGFSTEINAATDITELSDAIETNVGLIEAAADEAAVDAIDFPDYGAPDPITFTLTASAAQINEGDANTFTVEASRAVEADTDVVFQLRVDADGDTAQLADFNAGAFNPVTVTIDAGETTASFDMTAITNDGTEVSEKYTVEATVAGETLSTQVTILDGDVGGGQTFTLTTGLDIIPGMEGSNGNTVTSGDDLIIGVTDSDTSANSTLTTTDLIDAGEGTDTLKVVAVGATGTTLPTNFENVEVVQVQSSETSALTADISGVTGVTDLNLTKAAGTVNATAGATTDVDASMKAAGAALNIDGGDNVNVALTDVADAADVVTIGGATQAAGDVTVDMTGKAYKASDAATNTLSAINVTGGKTINVTQSATGDDSAAASDTSNATITQGAVTINGDASTTEVSVQQDAAVTAANAAYTTGGVTETASVKFGALKATDVLEVAGLTFTASEDMTAEQVASTFANLIDGQAYGAGPLVPAGDTQGGGIASNGTYTFDASGWTSGAANGDTVVFTSTTPNSNPGDLSPTLTDNSGEAVAPVVTTTQGKANDANAEGGKLGVVAGDVDITDNNGTIKTITVDGYGATSSTTTTSVLETLNLSNSSANMTVADSAATLALNAEKLGTATGDATLTITAAPTTLNVASTGNNYVALTAAATETLNVSGTGLFDADAKDLAALKTVNVTESAGLSLNAAVDDTVESVDTTGTTGKVTSTIDGTQATYAGGAGVDNVSLATGTALTKSIDLGAGDDMLAFSAAVTGSSATLSGGDGTDTLAMATANAASLDGAPQSFYTNFEQLALTDAAGTAGNTTVDTVTLDLDNLGFTDHVVTKGTADVTNAGNEDILVLDKMANNATVELTAQGLVTAQVTDAATNSTDVVNVVATTDKVDLNAGTFTANEVETLNVSAIDSMLDNDGDGIDDPAETITLALTADKATSVNISEGSANLTLDLTNSTKVTSVDGSLMTGDLNVTATNTNEATTLTGGSGDDVLTAATGTTADVLVGGLGDDTLSANSGMSELTGGAGNDLFAYGAAATSSNSSAYSTITDFGAGDLLQLDGANSFNSAEISLGATAVFQDYVNAAIQANVVGDVSWFEYTNNLDETDTYVVMEKTSNTGAFVDGEDLIVKLTGVVDLSNGTFNDTHDTIAIA